MREEDDENNEEERKLQSGNNMDETSEHDKRKQDFSTSDHDTSEPNKLLLREATPQIVASCAAMLVYVLMGCGYGYSSILLPQLSLNSSSINVTQEEASWIASVLPITAPVGSFLIGWTMDVLGRRTAIRIATFPFILGWIIIATAQGVPALCLGRVITGCAGGMVTPGVVYVTEISHPSLRATLTSMSAIFVSLGILAVYILGAAVHWQIVAGICSGFPLIILVAMKFLPESPSWLADKGRTMEAKAALKWFYPNRLVDSQMEAILDSRRIERKKRTLREQIYTLRNPTFWKPSVILFVFFSFQQFSGVYIVLFYMVTLFQKVMDNLNEYAASIVVGTLRVLLSVVSTVVSKKIGRRPLTFISGIGMTISMLTAGTYLYLRPPGTERDWVLLSCILFYVCISSIGFLIVPWAMSAELYPIEFRGFGGGLAYASAHILMFLSVKSYPQLLSTIQIYGVLWFFAAVAALGIVFVFFFLPETRNKTLQEIQARFETRLRPEENYRPATAKDTVNA